MDLFYSSPRLQHHAAVQSGRQATRTKTPLKPDLKRPKTAGDEEEDATQSDLKNTKTIIKRKVKGDEDEDEDAAQLDLNKLKTALITLATARQCDIVFHSP